MGGPLSSCSTLGLRGFMRVPRPPARIIGRTLSEGWLMASDGSTERLRRAAAMEPLGLPGGAGGFSLERPPPLAGLSCDSLDFDQGIERQGRDLNSAARRWRRDDMASVDSVHCGEVGQIGNEDIDLDHVAEGQADGPEDPLQIDESTLGLRLDAFEELPRRRIDTELAGAEEEAVDLDGLAIRAYRGRCCGRRDQVSTHRGSSPFGASGSPAESPGGCASALAPL